MEGGNDSCDKTEGAIAVNLIDWLFSCLTAAVIIILIVLGFVFIVVPLLMIVTYMVYEQIGGLVCKCIDLIRGRSGESYVIYDTGRAEYINGAWVTVIVGIFVWIVMVGLFFKWPALYEQSNDKGASSVRKVELIDAKAVSRMKDNEAIYTIIDNSDVAPTKETLDKIYQKGYVLKKKVYWDKKQVEYRVEKSPIEMGIVKKMTATQLKVVPKSWFVPDGYQLGIMPDNGKASKEDEEIMKRQHDEFYVFQRGKDYFMLVNDTKSSSRENK